MKKTLIYWSSARVNITMSMHDNISASRPERSNLRLVVVNSDASPPQGGPDLTMADVLVDEFDIDDHAACLKAVGLRQDKKAFQALFSYFGPRVKAYVMRLGCQAGQAEELTQETMIKVWRKADQFDAAKSAPSTWIFRIARNQRIDTFRRENRPELDPNDPSLVPEPEEAADTVIEQKQSEMQLLEAMKHLSEDQKAILKLSFFEDMSHGRIAEHLNIPLGTVKSRLRLALGKLRSTLDDSKLPPTDGRRV